MGEVIRLKRHFGIDGIEKIEVYEANGGYSALRKAIKEYSPDEIIEVVKASGLRGRGGAGFPTGVKWSFIPKDADEVFLVCNADEGEPGTFKDREIIRNDPHLLIEGMIISAYAIRANLGYIYIRGEFVEEANLLQLAIDMAYEKGYLGKNILGTDFSFDLYVHRGAGSYVCGEETALLNSLEGKRGGPRLKPPFPAQKGLYDKPTVVNNVETLAWIPYIVENGAEWFREYGTEKSPGTKLFSISGSIKKPGVYELPLGVPLRELIEIAGGVIDGRELKAVIPGGVSAPILNKETAMKVNMDYESLMAVGSMLGSGGVVVIDDNTCIVRNTWILARFYAHESCGQCTPCREGTKWMEKILYRIEHGMGEEDDIEVLLDITTNLKGTSLCPLFDAACMPINSAINNFREEFEYHIKHKKCPFRE